MDDLTKEELLEAYEEADLKIEELTDHIQELEQENVKLKRKIKSQGGGGADSDDMDDVLNAAALEAANEELRNKLAAAQADCMKLKEKNDELTSHAKVYNDEKTEAEASIRSLRKKVDDLQEALAESEKSMRSTMQKSTEFTKQKKDTKRAQMQLYEENEQLQLENKQLQEELRSFAENKKIMEALIARLADEKDELEIARDQIDMNKDESEARIADLEKELEEAQDKLQVALETDGQWEEELDKMQQEFAAESDRQLHDIERLNNTVLALEKENAVLKDSTMMGEKQQEVDLLRKHLKESSKSLTDMSNAMEALHEENKQLAERIMILNENIEEQVADRIAQERESARILHKKLESAMSRNADEERLRLETEKRMAELQRENDALSHWKVVYENGHGLQELARHQKKMKEDQRRLEMIIEKMSVQFSEVTEAKDLIEQSFMRLKEETGRDINFEYPEYELSRDMLSSNGKLRLQVAELEEQIDALESDTIRLRKALKNQAGMVGEGGFKYAGMAPELLVKVNEFAANLRDGRIDLPVDHRSSELIKENRKLKEDINILKMTVERYELELSGGGGAQIQQQLAEAMNGAMNGKRSEEEIKSLHEDVRNLLRVNDGLQHNLAHMQHEITMLLKQQIGQADGTADGITAMLLASNESLMKELQEIREASSSSAVAAANIRPPSEGEENGGAGSKRGGSALPPTGRKGAVGIAGATPRASGGNNPLGQTFGHGRGLDSSTPTKPFGTQSFQGAFTPSGNYATTPGYGGGYMPMQTPSTPHGRTMLTRTLEGMNLPPEEWAEELRDLNGQLIESLEQLFEREEELNQQKVLVENMETYLIEVKQQMTALYFEYAQKADEWEKREKDMKMETATLIGERDNLSLKLKRVEEAIDMISAETNKAGNEAGTVSRLEDKIKEYSRKVTVYEVNEAVLSRKFMALSEQMQEEQNLRTRLEADTVEMEGTLKRRILFLEQYKAMAGPKLAKLETDLQFSVPQSDFIAIQNELESLREDHLFALRRELEARVGSLESQEKGREVRILKNKILMLESEVVQFKQGLHNAYAELENQKAATQRIVDAQNAPPVMDARGLPVQAPINKELGVLVSEMAKYRGDASRLEVELVAANHRCQLLESRLRESNSEVDAAVRRVNELHERNESAEMSERAARKEYMDIKLKFEGGLTAEEAEKLKQDAAKDHSKIAELELSVAHLKEMAEISTQQAQTLSDFRDAYQDELKVLREHVAMQESRSDDDLIIGRLQRQLMATKTAYKTFTRKYHLLRGNMRQRELTERIMEHRLDQHEEGTLKLQETHRLEVAAMKKALRSVYESLISGADSTIRKSISGDVGKDKAAQQSAVRNSMDDAIALKKMLQRATGVGGVLAGRVTISDKLASMSEQIGELSALTESAGERAEIAEKRSADLEAECEKLREDSAILRRTIRDMNDILDAGGIGAGAGANAVSSKKNIQAQTRAIAARVLGLNEEVRALKLSSLQQKREVSLLQQDKKHLKHVLARVEDDLRSLEEGRLALDPQQSIMGGVNMDGIGTEDPLIAEFLRIREDLFAYEDQDAEDKDRAGKIPSTPPSNGSDVDKSHTSPQQRLKHSLHVDTGPDGEDGVGPSKFELLDKIEGANSELLAYKRDMNNYKRKVDSLHGQVLELQGVIDEKDEQIAYYERMATAEGLPTIRGNMSAAVNTAPRGKEWRMMRDEQEKLQEAASATIGSMRSLLEEKNRELERYRAKVEALQSGERGGVGASGSYKKGPSLADRRAEDLLKRLEDEERYNRGSRKRSDDDADKSLVQRLMDQIDHADVILQDKIKTVNQLEQKLMTANNQREKAEHRCGASLKEMEAMKVDMITLVNQLKERDESYMKLAQYNQIVDNEVGAANGKNGHVGDVEMLPVAKMRELKRKNVELQKEVHNKNEKIKQYRAIIVSLKEEFIKSEEERAINEMGTKVASEQNVVGGAEMESLRSQVSALRDGLRQAKADLDSARAGREKLVKARQAALEEGERLEGQVSRAEAQASAAQEALHRCRRDLEESRRKEVRLREKLKDIGGRGDEEQEATNSKKVSNATVERLQREIEILRSENVALRRAVAGTGGDIARAVATAAAQPDEESLEEDGGRPTSRPGRTIGEAPAVQPGSMEEMRQQLHSKWEAEKKLQKRIATLEKRLQAKIEECDDTQAQLRRQKDLAQQHQTAAQREKLRADKAKKGPENRLGGEAIIELDELQTRVFDLETENDALRRRAEVQLPNELNAARHQIDSLTNRLNSVESELEDSEMRRKQLAGAVRGGGGDLSSLRASEDRFLREEMLKDELNVARKQRLELEASLLERDSQAMELRFDVEAKEGENSRLRRRVRELESMCRSMGGNVGGGSAASESGRAAGARFNKDRDSEVVVETMRKAIDKLKAENERLRRGVGTEGSKISDVEKRLVSERKKSERLEEELKTLQSKVDVLESGGQKLVQRQQQIATLRKQLKTREDTISEQSRKISELESEMSSLQKSATDSYNRIQQLELQLASKALGRDNASNKKPTAESNAELTELRRRSAQQAIENESLRTQLADARREVVSVRQQGGEVNKTGEGDVASLKDQLTKLTKENSRLKNELSAFDLDFFEEIENLKYAHAEATRKLREMERKYGPIR